MRGRLHTRGARRRADYVLCYRPNQPIAVIEAKDNRHAPGDGMQQALSYAEALDVPFVFSSNGDGFLFHDRTGLADRTETSLRLDEFPSPQLLWDRYCRAKGIETAARLILEQPYDDDASGRTRPGPHPAGDGHRDGQLCEAISYVERSKRSNSPFGFCAVNTAAA